MDECKQLLSAADGCFFAGNVNQSQQLLNRALELAERQLMSCRDRRTAVTTYVNCHHYMAKLCRQINQTYEAHLHLQTAHHRVMTLARDTRTSIELRRAARHLSHTTYSQLLQFCQQNQLPTHAKDPASALH